METEINKYNLNEASLSVKMGENKTVSEEKIGFFVTTFHRSESIANTICNERLLVKDGIIDENFIKEEPNFFTDEANVISDKNSKITIHNESLIVKDGIIDEDFIKKEPQFLTDEEKAISEEKDTNKTIPDQYLVVKDEKIFEDFVKEEPHFSADEGKRVDSNKQDLRIAVPQKLHNTKHSVYPSKPRKQRSSVHHETTPSMRGAMIALHENGVPIMEIARRFEVSRSTVKRWIHRYEADSSVTTLPRAGRPRSTSQEDDNAIVNYVNENPFSTVNRIYKDLDLSCSANTVNNRLHEAGYFCEEPASWHDSGDQMSRI